MKNTGGVLFVCNKFYFIKFSLRIKLIEIVDMLCLAMYNLINPLR